MQMASRCLLLCLFALVLSSCRPDTDREAPADVSVRNSPLEISVEEAQRQVPFAIVQPSVPFEATQKSAKVLDTNDRFDAVEITYANPDEGLTLVMMMTNSKADSPPNGKIGLKLANGAQTWEQGDERVNAVYWRHEGLTYTLLSLQNNNGNPQPLYSHHKLIQIANSIK